MLVWLLVGSIAADVIAITAVLWCLADAIADMRIVHELGLKNGRRAVASADVRGQAIRLAQVMVLGAMALLILPLAEQAHEPSNVIVAVLLMFAAVHVLLGINAVMDLGMRRRLARETRKH